MGPAQVEYHLAIAQQTNGGGVPRVHLIATVDGSIAVPSIMRSITWVVETGTVACFECSKNIKPLPDLTLGRDAAHEQNAIGGTVQE